VSLPPLKAYLVTYKQIDTHHNHQNFLQLTYFGCYFFISSYQLEKLMNLDHWHSFWTLALAVQEKILNAVELVWDSSVLEQHLLSSKSMDPILKHMTNNVAGVSNLINCTWN